MNALQLNARTLHELADGQAELIINSALNTAIHDLDDRGDVDKKERIVVIELRMSKLNGMNVVDVVAIPKLPAYRTMSTVCKKVARTGGGVGLLFQGFNAENPDQPVFDEMEQVTQNDPGVASPDDDDDYPDE